MVGRDAGEHCKRSSVVVPDTAPLRFLLVLQVTYAPWTGGLPDGITITFGRHASFGCACTVCRSAKRRLSGSMQWPSRTGEPGARAAGSGRPPWPLYSQGRNINGSARFREISGQKNSGNFRPVKKVSIARSGARRSWSPGRTSSARARLGRPVGGAAGAAATRLRLSAAAILQVVRQSRVRGAPARSMAFTSRCDGQPGCQLGRRAGEDVDHAAGQVGGGQHLGQRQRRQRAVARLATTHRGVAGRDHRGEHADQPEQRRALRRQDRRRRRSARGWRS